MDGKLLKPIFRITLGGVGLMGAILGLIILSRQIKPYQMIRASGLESSALFYTESPKAVEVSFQMQQQFYRLRLQEKPSDDNLR